MPSSSVSSHEHIIRCTFPSFGKDVFIALTGRGGGGRTMFVSLLNRVTNAHQEEIRANEREKTKQRQGHERSQYSGASARLGSACSDSGAGSRLTEM